MYRVRVSGHGTRSGGTEDTAEVSIAAERALGRRQAVRARVSDLRVCVRSRDPVLFMIRRVIMNTEYEYIAFQSIQNMITVPQGVFIFRVMLPTE